MLFKEHIILYLLYQFIIYQCSIRLLISFPLKRGDILKKWIHAVRRKNFVPTKHSRICSEHFVETDYLHRPNINVPHLKPDAVPSIFKEFPAYYQVIKQRS